MKDRILKNDMETLKHIHQVSENIFLFIKELHERGLAHDASKLESPEREIFGEHSEELNKVEYGSEEYKALLDKVRPAIEHHYSKNRHHPEFHKNGINDMTLVDLIELFCDWKASSERVKNGNIRKSIEINGQRFNMSEQLVKIFENTAREMF